MKEIAKISVRNLFISYKRRFVFVWYSDVLEGLNTDCLRIDGFLRTNIAIYRLVQNQTPANKLTGRKKRHSFLEKESIFKTINRNYRVRLIKGMWPF